MMAELESLRSTATEVDSLRRQNALFRKIIKDRSTPDFLDILEEESFAEPPTLRDLVAKVKQVGGGVGGGGGSGSTGESKAFDAESSAKEKIGRAHV